MRLRGSSRLAVTTLDQFVSSLGNFLLVFGLAQSSSPGEFGVYALAIAVLSFALSLSRSIVATPFTIDSSSPQDLPGSPAMSLEQSSALALGLGGVLAGAVIPVVAVAALVGEGLVGVLVIFTVCLPLLTLQDLLRYVAVARWRPSVALAADSSWTLAVLGFFSYQLLADDPAPAWVGALVWGLGLVASVLVLVLFGIAARPRWAGLWERLRTDRRRPQLAAEALLVGGGPILLYTLVGVLCSTSTVAALRGASAVFGPFNTLLTAVALALVPEVRRLRRPRGERLLVGAIALAAVGGVAFGLVSALLVPDRAGSALLGSTWPLTQPILLATTAEYVGLALLVGGVVLCRAKNRVDIALRMQVVFWSGVVTSVVATGLVFGTALAVAMGLAVVSLAVGAECVRRGWRAAYE